MTATSKRGCFRQTCLVTTLAIAVSCHFRPDVFDLTFRTEFRSVELRWRCRSRPLGFAVVLCDRSTGDCSERHLLLGKSDSVRWLGGDRYEARLRGLRMLTEYSASVEPLDRSSGSPPHTVVLKTQGFAAASANCTTESSFVSVRTGPHFGGRVATEGAATDCSLLGDRDSARDTYTLHIDHALCGSRITEEGRIETTVVVHESGSAVTRNSRRFLVQCSLHNTFTVRAAFSATNEDVFTYDQYRAAVHDSRIASEQHSVVRSNAPPPYEAQVVGLLVVVVVVVALALLVVGLSIWCYLQNREPTVDVDSLSGASSFVRVSAETDAVLVPPAQTFPRAVNPFLGNQVALVSLRPVKELY